MRTARSRLGTKDSCRTSNVVGDVFLTPSAQNETRFSGAPLFTVSLKSPIGSAQFAPVVRTYSKLRSEKA